MPGITGSVLILWLEKSSTLLELTPIFFAKAKGYQFVEEPH